MPITKPRSTFKEIMYSVLCLKHINYFLEEKKHYELLTYLEQFSKLYFSVYNILMTNKELTEPECLRSISIEKEFLN